MFRYFLRIAYDGTDFHGWQKQTNAHSVQAELEGALSKLLSETISVIGCGRTDTGVHARDFYLHFDYQLVMENLDNLIYRMNQILPKSIFVKEWLKVDNEAHSRFDASSRTYKYFISHLKDPFNHRFQAFFPKVLNLNKMNEAAATLADYVDFTSFSKIHTDTFTNDCSIFYAQWTSSNDQLVFEIKANRFLRNMVRAIVGTCIEVGKGKMTVEEFRKVIEAKDRQEAGHSVPARGLFLERVEYPYF